MIIFKYQHVIDRMGQQLHASLDTLEKEIISYEQERDPQKNQPAQQVIDELDHYIATLSKIVKQDDKNA